jgi:hypothetical protein
VIVTRQGMHVTFEYGFRVATARWKCVANAVRCIEVAEESPPSGDESLEDYVLRVATEVSRRVWVAEKRMRGGRRRAA